MTNTLARIHFYRGLLLGMRGAGVSEFPVVGSRLHRAFDSTIDRARMMSKRGGEAKTLRFYLRQFVIAPQSDEMVIEGYRDALIHIDEPSVHQAMFVIDDATVVVGLERLGARRLFLELGQHFKEQLAA